MLSIFQSMDQFHSSSPSSSPYNLLLNALFLIPFCHYLLGFFLVTATFLYNFLGFHFFQEVLFGGTPITLTYSPSSPIYSNILSKCKILHSRYFATPWLSSPHIQTCFLHFFGRPPAFSYRRQLFRVSDGGTVALDWLMNHDVFGDNFHVDSPIPKDDSTPIVVVIPGLTSDSDSAYIKHIAFKVAKRGWNVVICNHRGLGGISITSDCFYNAGWTEDLRVIINWLHDEYPNAPLFAIGTSIGSNILVKYLGEDGERTPVAAGAAICNPWDLVIGDRFICRRLLQKLYDRALTVGLQGYAQLHEPRYSRLANWEGIIKSRSIRDFDHHATCLVGKFETVDAYYRHCSSSPYVQNVAVPLLCISALDDPVCTREAIPWDECRANKNVLLATTQHGGHLAFFEGLTASSVWWVRAVDEFLGVLHCSPYMHAQKKQASTLASPVGPSIDQGPYVNVAEDGMLVAVREQEEHFTQAIPDPVSETAQTSEQGSNVQKIKSSEQGMNSQDVKPQDGTGHIRRCLSLISQKRGRSLWLLAFIAIFTSWPLSIAFRKKIKRVSPAAL